MHPTQILSLEHQSLRRFLDSFERMIETIARTRSVAPEDMDRALLFLEEYGDRFHHSREDVLFERLRRVGEGRGERPVAALCREHARGRELLRCMRDHVQGAAEGSSASARALVHIGLAFIEHERQHARTEDQILFPLIDELLSDEQQAAVAAEFEHLEQNLAPRTARDLLDLADDLGQRYGPGASTPDSTDVESR